MTVERHPLDELVAMALAGELTNGPAVAGVLAATAAARSRLDRRCVRPTRRGRPVRGSRMTACRPARPSRRRVRPSRPPARPTAAARTVPTSTTWPSSAARRPTP